MRWGALGLALWVLSLGSAARAQPSDAIDALPSIVRVPVPSPRDAPVVISALVGYGVIESVLGGGDVHHRGSGRVAVGVQPWDFFAIGIDAAGRFDAHVGGEDDGDWSAMGSVGARARLWAALGMVRVGGELAIDVPGGPTIERSFEGTSVSGRALASIVAGEITAAITLGARYDRSAYAANAASLARRSDRLSLGASESDAWALFGVGATWAPSDAHRLGVEITYDLATGPRAPAPEASPIRIAGSFLATLPDMVPDAPLTLGTVIEVGLGARPDVDAALAPFEPRVAILLTASIALGAPREPVPVPARPEPEPEPSIALTTVRGIARGPNGAPLAGAEVQLLPEGEAAAIASTRADAEGRFALEAPPGQYVLRIAHAGHDAVLQTIEIGDAAQEIGDVMLSRTLPEAQLRGAIVDSHGAPIAATVRIGEHVGSTDPAGEFSIDLAPGTHTLVIEAPGFLSRTLTVDVERGSVRILNVTLWPALD